MANLTIKIKIDHLNLSKWVELDNEIVNLKEVFTSNLYFLNTKIIYLCQLPFRFYASLFRLKAVDGEGEATVIFNFIA